MDQRYSAFPESRLAARSGSVVEASAIMEKPGNSRTLILVGIAKASTGGGKDAESGWSMGSDGSIATPIGHTFELRLRARQVA